MQFEHILLMKNYSEKWLDVNIKYLGESSLKTFGFQTGGRSMALATGNAATVTCLLMQWMFGAKLRENMETDGRCSAERLWLWWSRNIWRERTSLGTGVLFFFSFLSERRTCSHTTSWLAFLLRRLNS